MRIDHIGYAVKDIERSKPLFEAMGWSFGETVRDAARNVDLCFGSLDGWTVELVAPMKAPDGAEGLDPVSRADLATPGEATGKRVDTHGQLSSAVSDLATQGESPDKRVRDKRDDMKGQFSVVNEPRTPVDSYLEKTGPTPYHICYKSDDFEADIENLKKKRFAVVSSPAPAVAFGGRRVVFMYSLHAGLIEIVEE